MEGFAEQQGVNARFTGFQRNVPEWLIATDIAVVPSHVEPLGNATLEAMAHGRPVVGTRVGGIPEMISHQETGLLVEPHNPPDLARALERLISDRAERERLGSAARERCQRQFSLRAHALAAVDQYSAMLDGTGAPGLP